MKEPIIVTAFWDVGRSKDCEIPRSNERYYKEFAAWARIKNELIVYTDEYSVDEIKKIRNQYGLGGKTRVIVNDIFQVDNDIFNRMLEVEKKKAFTDFRYRPEAMENQAKFDYAWFMKYWCMADAVKYANDDDVFAWFDFGFNHIDKCYSNMEEFSFTWTLNKEINEVQAYSLKNVEDVAIFDVLQFMQDTVMGVFFLVPIKCALEFWKVIRKSMESLLMIECIDDDQILVLMAHKWRPDIIKINISEWWYLALKENGADHLSVRLPKDRNQSTIKHKIWAKKYDYIHKTEYLKRTKNRMNKAVDSAL